ncbi:hypothetical protein ACFSJU_13890 [Paradesertivirga mongoliensis]|uniref:Uncharacterized protein n=1 Tax=Paradesertivirga mongoliensis TaxID=2100740 RepID=A0ABW4ZP50_9SPHI|nr:hypothetical protein [Pedobacter mongoliensis]
MKLTELLLNGFSFKEILKQFSMDQSEIKIQDEDLILSRKDLSNIEILKERILIQGKSTSGIVNLFGTLHYNLMNQLAVFELDSVETKAVA